MIRNLKIMGLALVAVLAMSAVAASSASATNHVLTTTNESVTLVGTQGAGASVNKLKIVGQFVECTTATYNATVTGPTVSSITVTPTYAGCSLAGVPITIDMNGCKYILTGNTDANNHAQVHIEECNAGKHIVLTVTGLECDITIREAAAPNGNQTPAEGVRYTNIGPPGTTEEVTIDLTVKPKITVDHWPAGSSNPICEEITVATTGRLTGDVTVTAKNHAGTHVGITVS